MRAPQGKVDIRASGGFFQIERAASKIKK